MNHNSYSLCSSASSTSSSAAANGLFASNRIKTSANVSQPVLSTLPITCQICLSKVKEPCICPNLHVFCAMCIEIWLEKTKQCPTCRISINKENPCRRILGGIENCDDVDLLKPTEFSHPSTRKARYLSLFQQYEDEINRLLKQIDSLDAEVAKFKEASKNINPASMGNNMSPNSAQYDMIQMLKTKLEQVQASLEETIKERNKLKEANKKLESENSILLQDVVKLKASLNEKSAQMSSRYTMAALESKLDSYEKEVKQLQKALDQSDKYIADLESRLKIDGAHGQTSSSNNSSCLTSNDTQTTMHNTSSNALSHSQSFSKAGAKTGDSKTVKFADKIDTIPASASLRNHLTSPQHHSSSSSSSSSSNRVILIPNDRFYGSPSKTPTSAHKSAGSAISNVHISSFADRMKKSALSAAAEPAQSSASNAAESSGEQMQTTPPSSGAPSYLFSPMKRLRLDEVYLEKPAEDELAKRETNENLSPASSKYRLSKRSPSDSEVMKRLGNKFASASFDKSNYNQPHMTANGNAKESEFMTTAARSTSPSAKKKEGSSFSNELDDCLQLLNEAEKKIQSRESPPKSPLAGKYATSGSDHRLTRSPSLREKTMMTYESSNGYGTYANKMSSPGQKKATDGYYSLPDKYFVSSKIFENDAGASSDSASTSTTTSDTGVSASSSSIEMNGANLGDRNYTSSSDHGPMFTYSSEHRRSGSYSPSKSCSNMSTLPASSSGGKLVESSCNVTMPKNPIYAKYNTNSNGMGDHDYSQPSHVYRSRTLENDYRMNHN